MTQSGARGFTLGDAIAQLGPNPSGVATDRSVTDGSISRVRSLRCGAFAELSNFPTSKSRLAMETRPGRIAAPGQNASHKKDRQRTTAKRIRLPLLHSCPGGVR